MKIYEGSVWSGTWTCFSTAQEILHRILPARPWDVLILGCGDGKHTIPFLLDGHHVVGVDDDLAVVEGADLPFMGETVRMNSILDNIRESGVDVAKFSLELGDYMDIDLPGRYDVVLTSCSWQFRRNWKYPIRSIIDHMKSFVRYGGCLVADYMQPHQSRYEGVPHYIEREVMPHFFDPNWELLLNRDDGLIRERHVNGEQWHEHRYASLVAHRSRQA